MSPKHPPNLVSLRRRFSYNKRTGLFRNRSDRSLAGYIHKCGYVYIAFEGVNYLAHRLAWYYVYGTWPPVIDHKDRIRHNNAILNLREATHIQNMANTGGWGPKKKSALPKGVYNFKDGKRFIAFIRVNKRTKYLGIYDCAEKAGAAYKVAAFKHFGEFAHT